MPGPLHPGQVVTVMLDGQARTAFVATFRTDAAGRLLALSVLVGDELKPVDPAVCVWGEQQQHEASMGRDWNQGVLPGLLPEQPRLFEMPAAPPRRSGAERYAEWLRARDGTMGAILVEVTGAAAGLGAEVLGARWRRALRKRYPRDANKLVRADFVRLKLDEPTERTVEAWLGGQAPRLFALAAMVLVHGPALAAEVLAPGSRWELSARVAEELRGVQARLSELGVA